MASPFRRNGITVPAQRSEQPAAHVKGREQGR